MVTAKKRSIQDIPNLRDKRVLVRVDYNVPLDENGTITDDSRIKETLPTLNYLVEQGARVILMAHFGRPKGQVVESMRLTPVVKRLAELLPNANVQGAKEVVSEAVKQQVAELKAGNILMLENTRFEAGEEKNDPEFARQLAELADIYVNDAFGAAHRAHASTEGVAKHVDTAVAGLLMAREIEAMGGLLNNPARPFTAIVGGSKISTKLQVVTELMKKVDTLIIGGGMAYTFLLAQGYSVGKSIVEPDFVPTAKEILADAKEKGITLVISQDLIVGDDFSPSADTKEVSIDAIPDAYEGLDVGPKTREAMREAILKSKSILWNGPVGVFEMKPFENGTKAIAEAVAEATKNGAKSVLGGGDTVAAIEKFGYGKDSFTHVSTGGGASLEFLEGKELPGIAALENAETVAV